MNLRFILLFTVILIVSCSKKQEPTFIISGTVSPFSDTYIILKQESDIERKVSTFVDSIYVNNDGTFITKVFLEPHLYTLHFNDSTALTIAANKGEQVDLNVSNLDQTAFKTSVSGSADAVKLVAYENYRALSLDTLVKSVRRKIKILKNSEKPDQRKIDSLGNLEIANYDKHLAVLNNYISENMKNSLGLYATSIRWKGQENFDLFDSLTTNFERAYSNLEIAKKLREKVTRLKQTAIGGTVAEIELATPDGSTLSLFSVHKKYTLIDFWASWCGPCRRESSSLNELYTTFKNKGFEIYGVSLDDDREKWVKAIEKDTRIWANVSSLERFKTPAAFDYAVTALPDNYLIDSNRKIIAKNVHGQELAKLLEELLEKEF